MPLGKLEDLDELAGPYEIMELRDGERIDLHVERFELGRAEIRPRDGRPPHEVPFLRVFVPAADKVELPRYWDITAKHLIAGMLGYLDAGIRAGRTFRITKHGKAPRARFTLDVLAAD